MTPLQPSADNLAAVNIADIKPLLDIGREAYSEVYVHVHGEDDNHYEALDAAIKAVLAAAPAHPSRGVVDEAMVERECEAVARRDGIDWNNAEWQATHKIEAGRLRARISAALQAAALPAVPSVPEADEVDVDAVMAIIDKWMISYDHIGTGSARSGQISEREWEEDRAKLLELLAATPKDQP